MRPIPTPPGPADFVLVGEGEPRAHTGHTGLSGDVLARPRQTPPSLTRTTSVSPGWSAGDSVTADPEVGRNDLPSPRAFRVRLANIPESEQRLTCTRDRHAAMRRTSHQLPSENIYFYWGRKKSSRAFSADGSATSKLR